MRQEYSGVSLFERSSYRESLASEICRKVHIIPNGLFWPDCRNLFIANVFVRTIALEMARGEVVQDEETTGH